MLNVSNNLTKIVTNIVFKTNFDGNSNAYVQFYPINHGIYVLNSSYIDNNKFSLLFFPIVFYVHPEYKLNLLNTYYIHLVTKNKYCVFYLFNY